MHISRSLYIAECLCDLSVGLWVVVSKAIRQGVVMALDVVPSFSLAKWWTSGWSTSFCRCQIVVKLIKGLVEVWPRQPATPS